MEGVLVALLTFGQLVCESASSMRLFAHVVFDRVRSTNDVLDQGVIIWVVHMGRAGVHCP